MAGARNKNLIGNVYNRLTVVELDHIDDYGNAYWRCVCTCGNFVNIRRDKLIKGIIKSCGCLRRENGKSWAMSNRLPEGRSSAHAIYLAYKHGAKTRGHAFDLEFEQFYIISQKECYYCGTAPSNISKNAARYGTFVYNGIDRVDNAKGYAIDNVVPCCWNCNRMKQSMSVDDFIAHISKIYERFKNE